MARSVRALLDWLHSHLDDVIDDVIKTGVKPIQQSTGQSRPQLAQLSRTPANRWPRPGEIAVCRQEFLTEGRAKFCCGPRQEKLRLSNMIAYNATTTTTHQNAVWRCGQMEQVRILQAAAQTRMLHLTASPRPPLHLLVLGVTKSFAQSLRLTALDPCGDQNNLRQPPTTINNPPSQT